MPALGMAQETGRLITWHKKAGASVKKGEPLIEIETDKAIVDIEASATGILAEVSAQEGDEIPVGQTIAWILSPGEDLPALTLGAGTSEVTIQPQVSREPYVSPVAQKIAAQLGVDISLVKSSDGKIKKTDILAFYENQRDQASRIQKILASPKAKRLARERNIGLSSLTGSGPGGAILAADVLASRTTGSGIPPADMLLQDSITAKTRSQEVTSIWLRMVERISQSWESAPHFYLMREVNASRLLEWRLQLNENSEVSFTYTDLLVKLTAVALKENPRLNASWNGKSIQLLGEINIGLATAVEDGLVVPVIHQADTLSLIKISERRQELVDRARAKRLHLEDLQNGTFTISNLGMYGVDVFSAVINPPQAAILAVGRIADRVVAVKGQPTVQPMMIMSLSCDHRAVDGALGAKFLDTLANLIEKPLRLVH